jgi:hypothetical protein
MFGCGTKEGLRGKYLGAGWCCRELVGRMEIVNEGRLSLDFIGRLERAQQ